MKILKVLTIMLLAIFSFSAVSAKPVHHKKHYKKHYAAKKHHHKR
jgi:hypothetical protein